MAGLEGRLAGLSPEKRELLLAKLRERQAQKPRTGIPVREDRSSYPMTASQRGFWVLERLNSGLGVNNIPAAVRLRGSLNVDALRRAFAYVVQRHETLRAGFRSGPDGNPAQFVRESVQVDLPVFTVSPSDGRSVEDEAVAFVTRAATKPFDLSKDLLVRAFLVRLGEKDHLLSVTFHHIIADAWSVGVFVRDLVTAYEAFVRGDRPALKALPIQFFDFAAWQEAFLRSEKGQKQLEYWLEKLSDTEEYLNLPTDRPKGPETSYRGDHIPFAFGPELSRRVLEFCKQRRMTPYVFLLSAYALLLARYADQDVVRVGSPVANREKPELRDLIGLFINLTVLRADLAGNPSFSAFLEKSRQTVLETLDHSGVPIEVLIDKLYPKRSSGENPLAQVLFDFQESPLRRMRVAGLEVEPVRLESGTVKYDLVLSLGVDDGLINAVFGYRTDLFEERTVRSLIGHYLKLVESAVTAPEKSVWQLPMLGEEERKSILAEWSTGDELDLPRHEPVHRLFEAQVERTPQALALVDFAPGRDGGEIPKLTYAELDARANQVAHHLVDLGVGPESIVGLALRRSPGLFVGLLGILKAGAAYLPLDPGYPPERLKYMLQDSHVRLVITESGYAELFAGSEVEPIPLDDPESPVRTRPTTQPGVHVDPDNTAYLIYTSGSTGKPKAVMATHRGLVNHALATRELRGFGPEDRVLQYISISFDAAGEEIYPALLSGATLVLPGPSQQLSGFDLLRVLEQGGVTVLHVPVPVWHYFVDFLEEQDLTLPDSIRLVLAGGEQPSIATLRKAARRVRRPVDFVNLYGPTETTIASNAHEFRLLDTLSFEYDLVPIGRPMPNVRVYLLDRALEPVPRGVLGEIYIGGAGVARGYRDRPDLTAERFLPDPFSPEPGARMYRTGDLGRFNSRGEVVFAGRRDYQVKIRGFRVELGEIEAVLNASEKVRQCVVVPRGASGSEKKLVAYVVPAGDARDADELRQYLKERLPDYMVPAHFVFLDELPLTPTGKLDRKALPDPTKGDVGRTAPYVPPRTRLEKFLYEMWKDILGIEKIGIHDNFFELGGSSIQAASFVNRLQDALGEYVYIVAIYDAPTIAGLRDYLRREYPEGVYRLTGERVDRAERTEKIGPEDVVFLRSIVKSPGPYVHTDGHSKNPPAIFVLSAPRSGSTLTRAILGGHPRLFSPPELQLLNYDTLGERKRQLSGRDDFWLDGTIRALMEIKQCSVEEARALMAELEEKDLPTKEFYRLMQEWLGDRVFVDKTPNYALSPHILQRAEEYFENNRYIHLIRHPYGVIPSFERAKLHVFYPPFFKKEHPYTPRQLAELVWIVSNQNILNFLKHVPPERQFRLYYEELVTRPEETIRKICEFLEIEPHPDMFEPQKDSKRRMTDGLNELSKMLGDVRFHEHRGISADRAYSWKRELTEDYLSDIAWEMVEAFGYEGRDKLELVTGRILRPIQPLAPGEQAPLSFSQQRLWFLDQLEPNSPFYNMPMTVRLRGRLDVQVLQRALQEVVHRHESLRTIFRADREGKPRAEVLPSVPVRIQVRDLTSHEETEKPERLQAEIREAAQKPFDLSKGPLLRAHLFRLGERDQVLLLNMHHIISDGLSLEILVKELAALYAAFSEGKESPLRPLPIQYGAYAKWQREWLESEALKKQLRYWREELAGVPSLLQLPTDRPRPRVQSYRGSKTVFELPAELGEGVRRLAARYRTTPYTVLLATYALLLHRYSGQTDFCVGTPVSGRTRKELEGLIGFFVNTLPLRMDFSANVAFELLVKNVQRTIQNALAHQDVPLEKILDQLDLERDTSYNPLFQTVFIYENNPLKTLELGELQVEPLEVDTGTAKFDLSLAVVEGEEGFRGILEFNTDLFDQETVEQLAGHFVNLLRAAVREPSRPVHELSLLEKREEREILARYAFGPEKDQGEFVAVHELFRRQAIKRPHALAVVHRGESLTYGELDARSNQLSHFLLQKGLGREEVVAILLDRSVDLLVAMLGVLKAGAAYVPVDPSLPKERLEHILHNSGARIVLTSGELASEFAERVSAVLNVQSLRSEIAKQPDEAPDVRVHPENLAYVIYTSGSSGEPKGVAVRHASLTNHVRALSEAMGLGEGQRVLQYITPSFDASAEEIYPTLTSGAALVLPPSAKELGAGDVIRIAEENKITVLHLPVPIWHLIVDTLHDEGKRFPGALRLVMVGGESPAVRKLEQATQLLEHPIEFMNLYGPTEATITTTFYSLRLEPGREVALPVVPIGRPIANVQTYVLDGRWSPIPLGVVGELFIGGAGVARGYLSRPDLTAEAFLPDPFAQQSGARMYRTGDLVRVNRQGDLVFVGRRDFQVKIRGLRIELGEIEHHLAEHPDVRQVVVDARRTPRGMQLVAYVLPAAGDSVAARDLREYLRARLPDYMVPAHYVFVDAFPTTPSGKIDRRRLPQPDLSGESGREAPVPPRNEREATLLEIWKQVLGAENLGVRDNFFELGGDSILSIQVVARANQAGLKITPKQIFEHPTIEELAAVAEEGVAVHAEQGIVSGAFPLTPIQRWFFELDLAHPEQWNQSLALRLKQPLDGRALEKATAALVEHHDLLRARFLRNEHGWAGEILEAVESVPFEQYDLSDEAPDEAERHLLEVADRVQASFDLEKGPLFRLAYFRMPEGKEDALLIVAHHLVVDTYSWRVLMEDLLAAYEHSASGKPVRLPPKTTSFAYWARKLEEWAESEALAMELEYWKGVSRKVRSTAAPLPLDNSGGENLEKHAAAVTVSLTEEETEDLLRRAPTAYNTQIEHLLLAALLRAYYRWTGRSALYLDLESHGRESLFEDVNLSRTVGWFTAMYPLVLEAKPGAEIGQWIRNVKEAHNAVPNRGIGFGILRAFAGEQAAELRELPEAPIGFNYLGQFEDQNSQQTAAGASAGSLGAERHPENRRIHVLEVGALVVEGQLQVRFSYSADQLRRETAEKWAKTYVEELRQVLQHCLSPKAGGYRPSDFAEAGLDEEELEELMEELDENWDAE